MSLQYAILGFLSIESMTGYSLKKTFDESVQHFWPANQSQIYRTLADLHEQGWAEPEVIAREGRLDKKLYHITPEGQQALHAWLSAPLPPQDTREAFLIQIYFGSLLSDGEVQILLQDAIVGIESKLLIYRQINEAYLGEIEKRDDPKALWMRLLTLEFGIMTNQASLAWLKRVSERLSMGDYTLEMPGGSAD